MGLKREPQALSEEVELLMVLSFGGFGRDLSSTALPFSWRYATVPALRYYLWLKLQPKKSDEGQVQTKPHGFSSKVCCLRLPWMDRDIGVEGDDFKIMIRECGGSLELRDNWDKMHKHVIK